MRLRRHDERTVACLAHLAGIIPGWGALVMGWVLWRYRERSRGVVYHARQALVFHVLMLTVVLVPLLLYGIGRIAGVLRPDLGTVLVVLAQWIGLGVFVLNSAFVLVAADRVIEGHSFEFPLHRRVMNYLDLK